MSNTPQLLTLAEAQQYLGCHRKTLWMWIRDRRVPVIQYGTRKYVPIDAYTLSEQGGVA